MDETLIDNWNSTINKNDMVYFLGDLSFHPYEYLKRLNGKIIFVLGNHDLRLKEPSRDIITRETKRGPLVLCHFPLLRWNRQHYGALHLHGHCHGTLPPSPLTLDVGVDGHAFFPYSEEEVFDVILGSNV